MKFPVYLIGLIFFSTGCSLLKPASSENARSGNQMGSQGSIQYLDNLKLNSASNQQGNAISGRKSINSRNAHFYSHPSAIEYFSPLQFKFAILEDAQVEEMQNERLLEFMDEWYGAKYHYGGNDKEGIDCSAFVSTLVSNVYGINSLPRISSDQYNVTIRISRIELQEGDLVFFHTLHAKRKMVTHVGVYLRNNKFIHASISGVQISDMASGYYSEHFVGGGRINAPVPMPDSIVK